MLSISGVATGATINSITITGLNIAHTFDADLDIFLFDPEANVIELSTDNGGSGDNYTNTSFDDSAATSITGGLAPFNGAFRPEQTLASLIPGLINGNWTLKVVDDAGQDVGTLSSWTININ